MIGVGPQRLQLVRSPGPQLPTSSAPSPQTTDPRTGPRGSRRSPGSRQQLDPGPASVVAARWLACSGAIIASLSRLGPSVRFVECRRFRAPGGRPDIHTRSSWSLVPITARNSHALGLGPNRPGGQPGTRRPDTRSGQWNRVVQADEADLLREILPAEVTHSKGIGDENTAVRVNWCAQKKFGTCRSGRSWR